MVSRGGIMLLVDAVVAVFVSPVVGGVFSGEWAAGERVAMRFGGSRAAHTVRRRPARAGNAGDLKVG